MRKSFGFIVFFLIVYIISIGLLYKHFSAKIAQLELDKKELQTVLASKRYPQLNLNDIYLFSQKAKTLSEKKMGKLYFDFAKKNLDNQSWQIDITLSGEEDVAADAADLQLDYSSDLDIVDINFGDAFPSYPRIIDKDRQLTLTGISSITDNKIIYASPGKIFVTLVIKKKQDNPNQGLISVNWEGTKIYSSSKNILDTEKNFDRIEI